MTNIAQAISMANIPPSGRSKNKAQALAKKEQAAQASTDALKATPGKVLAVVDKSSLIVSIGSKQGFKAGDKLGLYDLVDIKDDKGAVVFSEEKYAGEVVLQNVQEDRSRASYTSSAEVKSGWMVKAK